MTIQTKSWVAGFFCACLLVAAAIAAFLFVAPGIRTIFHDQVLPSGKIVKITMCNFAWGVEHDERHVGDDSFVLEYVSTVPHTDLAAVDRETVEVFELIRPISELWKLKVANVSAFPKVERKGQYFIYVFTQSPQGAWTHERKPAQVFVND